MNRGGDEETTVSAFLVRDADRDALPFISAAQTDVGAVRSLNEDSLLDRPDIGLWVVADGMGGHEAGDQASQAIVNRLGRLGGPLSPPQLLAQVRNGILETNDWMRAEAARRGSNRGMGSTVVALMISGHHFCCLWAGDSRIYRSRNGRLQQITRDHSLVQDLVDRGLVRPEEAHLHPQGNIITRAVGADDELDLDKTNDRVAVGDIFLLCSDGLTREVNDREISAQLSASDSPDAIVGRLVDLALERGAADNVTAVAVRVVGLHTGGNH